MNKKLLVALMALIILIIAGLTTTEINMTHDELIELLGVLADVIALGGL